MPNNRLDFHNPHRAQQRVIDHAARYRVVACGRRFGKTELGKIEIVNAALKGGHCWWLAPTHQMAADVWRDLKQILAPLTDEIHNGERFLTLRGKQGRIAVRSTHYPDNLRGAGLDFAVLDEAAFMEPSVWPEVVRPMLLERKGRALFLSTPYGRNWFWHLYNMGNDPLHADWVSFQYASSANPLVDKTDLQAIRGETPQRVYLAEYMAEFVDDAGAVFRGVTDAATAAAHIEPQHGRRYIMGVDWGRDIDYTAAIVLDVTEEPAQMVAISRFHQMSYSQQRQHIADLAHYWNVSAIWAESNSIGTVNIEELTALGLPVQAFTTTHRSKNALIEGLAIAIERGDVRLQADTVLLDELRAYTIDRLPSGGFRYGAPSGGHDDTVIALALAWHGAKQGTIQIAFV